MASDPVRLDYGLCTSEAVQSAGLTEAEFEALGQAVESVHFELGRQSASGRLGFMELPQMPDQQVNAIQDEAARLSSLADTLVVLGIGGSALGATAVDMALGGAMRNSFERPEGGMRLFVADSPDPLVFGRLLENLDLGKTAFNVVSKSGSTAETMSQFMVVRDLLDRTLGQEEADQRLVFTTDPEKGNLRLLSNSRPVSCLDVPPNVGGRFSVLSAVGLLPLACAGHDIRELLSGARQMAEKCQAKALMENPAYMFAALTVHYMRQGRNILVMMPYAADLFGLAQWFAQLWAESLGKADSLDGRRVNLGQTPVAAVGPTDQHSQLQLYMEGPQDKLICFVTLDNYGQDLEIPPGYEDIEALTYLGGKGLSELVAAEAQASARALAEGGRPSLSLRLPRLNAHVMGQVLYMLELATVTAGGLLGIDPLDQPGVELGKRLTYGLMGRPGFEQEAERMRKGDITGRHLV